MKLFTKARFAGLLAAILPFVSSPVAPAQTLERLGTTPGAQQIAVTPAEDPAEKITKQILRDQVQLAKYNLYYRLEAVKQGRWKGLRYFGFNQANNGLTEAGLIVGVTERMLHIHGDQFKRLHTGALMHGNVLGAVGQTIGAAGSMQEFLINGYHCLRVARKGYSPGQAKKRARELIDSINVQLVNFNQLVEAERAQGKEAEVAVHSQEIKVLADIRDLLISEFNSFHVGATRTLWAQQSFYLLDTAKNVTGAVGCLYGYKALRQRRRLFNQPLGVLVTISGAFIIANPILGRLIGRAMGSLDGYLLARSGLQNKETTLAKLQADSDELNAICQRYKDPDNPAMCKSIKRVDLYSIHSKVFDRELAQRAKETSAGTRIAVQNVLSGAFVGGNKVANGVQLLLAGYKYHEDARMTNVTIGTGSIPSLAGTSYSIADNFRIQIMAERNRYRAKKKGQLSSQIIRQELDQLDNLEKSIDAL